jgi:hypothetical protein
MLQWGGATVRAGPLKQRQKGWAKSQKTEVQHWKHEDNQKR